MLPDDEEWWTKERACSHIGITTRTFNRYIDAGVLAVKMNGTLYVQRGARPTSPPDSSSARAGLHVGCRRMVCRALGCCD